MEVGYPVLVSAIEQLKKLRDVSDALASLYSLCNSLNMWFETMLTELHNSNGFKDNTNVYDGEEVMNMFATKCDLNMDTVSVFESFLPAMNEQDVNALLSDSNTNAVSLGFEEDEQEPTLGIEVVFMIKKLLLTYRFLAANTAAYKLVLKCEGFSDRVDRRIRSGATSNNMDMFYTATFNLW